MSFIIDPYRFVASSSEPYSDYQITGIENLEYDVTNGSYCNICKIDDTHFIVVHFSQTVTDGYIKTFSIDADGTNITEIDSVALGFGAAYNWPSDIIQISSSHYIFCHQGTGADGYAQTFSIDGSYNITLIDSFEFDTVNGTYNALCMLDSTHFLVAYQGANGDGFARVLEINGSYVISGYTKFEFDTADASWCDLVTIDSTHVMLQYATTSDHSVVKTLAIDGSYNITQVDSLTHDTTNGLYSGLCKLDDTHYASAYTGAVGDNLKVFSIDGSYNITEESDNAFATTSSSWSDIIALNTNSVAIAYIETSGGDVVIRTYTFDGSFTSTQEDTYTIDLFNGAYVRLCKITDNIIGIVYRGSGNDGYVQTVEIT